MFTSGRTNLLDGLLVSVHASGGEVSSPKIMCQFLLEFLALGGIVQLYSLVLQNLSLGRRRFPQNPTV